MISLLLEKFMSGKVNFFKIIIFLINFDDIYFYEFDK